MTDPSDEQRSYPIRDTDNPSEAGDTGYEGPDGGQPRAAEPVFSEPSSPEPVLGEPAAPEPIFGQQPQTSVAIFGEDLAAGSAEATEAEAPVAPVVEAPAVPAPSIAAVIRSGDRPAIAELAERAARIVFAAAIFLVPVVFDPRTIDSFNLVKLTTLWFLGIVSAGAWLYSTHLVGGSRSIPRLRLVRLSLVLLAITGVATLFSPNRTLSVFGLYHRYAGLLSIAIYVGVVLLIVLLYRRRPDALRDVAVAIGAAGGVAAGYVVLQRLGFDVSEWRQASGTTPRFPIGTLGNSAFSASFIGIAAPFAVYLGFSARNIARKFAWLAVGIVMLLGLWFTEGRAGILGAAAGILALVLFTSRVKPVQKFGLVVLTLFVLALTPVLFGDPTDPAQRGVLRTGTAGYRVQIWDASWRIFMNRPLLGWGPESFYGNYTRFRTADEARRQGLAITDKPHSIYLEWATATGIAGFGAWLLLVGGAVALVAGRAAKLIRTRRMLASAFGAGLVAYLAQGIYSIDVPPLALIGWVAVGAIAVLLDRGASSEETADSEAVDTTAHVDEPAAPAVAAERRAARRSFEAPEWLKRSWVAPTAVGVLLLFLIFIGFGPLRADHAAWSAERRQALGWSTDTLELYDKAISLNPREAAYRGLTAAYYERTAGNPAAPLSPEDSLRRSVSFYIQALRIQPRNVYFMINLARVYSRLGKTVDEKYFAVGDRYLGTAVTLDPLNPQMHDLYADLLNQWQKELGGRERRDVLRRAQTQAGIAQALRAGRVVR